MSRLGAAVALALLAVCAGSACGGDADATPESRFACVERAQNAALAEVVTRFYREGKLGGPKRIEADIAGLEDLGEARTSFLRGDGTMVPWAQMSQEQRFTFLSWVDLPRVNRILGDAENEAVEEAARRAEPRCEASES